jgi:hypothetical protein
MPVDPKREFFRHTVATLAYRCGKTLRGAPENFAAFRVAEKTRTPIQILAHIGDLLDWVSSQAKGKEEWHNVKPLPWNEEVARFFAALEALDAYLASDEPLAAPVEKLFQGAIADALTHTGQLAMIRRLAGAPVKGENYNRAHITAGHVGPDQPFAVREFD